MKVDRREALKLAGAPVVCAPFTAAVAAPLPAPLPPLDSPTDLAAAMKRLRSLNEEVQAVLQAAPAVVSATALTRGIHAAIKSGRWLEPVEAAVTTALAPIAHVRRVDNFDYCAVEFGQVHLVVDLNDAPKSGESDMDLPRLRRVVEPLLTALPREVLLACVRLKIGLCCWGNSLFMTGALDDPRTEDRSEYPLYF